MMEEELKKQLEPKKEGEVGEKPTTNGETPSTNNGKTPKVSIEELEKEARTIFEKLRETLKPGLYEVGSNGRAYILKISTKNCYLCKKEGTEVAAISRIGRVRIGPKTIFYLREAANSTQIKEVVKEQPVKQ